MSALDGIKEKISTVGVVVYSKSYCPYCVKAKKALQAIGAKFEAIELDKLGSEGSEIQSALAELTGQRTVPNVFINGTSIGGGDDTARLQKNGQLATLCEAAGAL